MSRFVAALLALIATMFGQPISAATAFAATAGSPPVYVYHGHHDTTGTGCSSHESRRTNTSDDGSAARNAVDRRLSGAPVNWGYAKPPATYTYDHQATVAHDARAMTPMCPHGRVVEVGLSSIEPRRVAANGVARTCRLNSVDRDTAVS